MGCCGSKSSSAGTTSVNLSQNKDKREANWRATGQIILRDSNLKARLLHSSLLFAFELQRLGLKNNAGTIPTVLAFL